MVRWWSMTRAHYGTICSCNRFLGCKLEFIPVGKWQSDFTSHVVQCLNVI